MSPRRTASAALAGYVVLSLVLFGLPLLSDPGHTILASDTTDSSLFMWFYAWWPHALLHGLNPLITHAMFVPEGFNLQWTTSMPGPSLLLAPLTLATGPATTWNVIQLLAPALSAWGGFLLCRRLTRATAPSLLGGYLFGFSPYVLAHLTGGPFLALIGLVPLLVLLVCARVEQTLSRRAFIALTAVTLIAQFSISTEVLVAIGLFGAIAFALSWGLMVSRRPALSAAVLELAAAGLVAAVIVSPFLIAFVAGRHYPPTGTFFSAAPQDFVSPPRFVALAADHAAPHLFQASGENYLGVALILALLIAVWERRRRRSTWVLAGAMVIAAVASLGRVVYTGTRYTAIPLPWHLLSGLPVLRYAIPVRFAAFVILPAAVLCALWLAERGTWWRWALVLLAAVSFLPAVGNAAFTTHIADPPFFSRGLYRAYLRPADRVLTVPTRGPSERWQADTRFAFRLAAGYAGAYPPSYARFAAFTALTDGTLPPHPAADLRAFVRAKAVTAIVADPRTPGPWRALLATLGVRPVAVGGVLVYRLAPAG